MCVCVCVCAQPQRCLPRAPRTARIPLRAMASSSAVVSAPAAATGAAQEGEATDSSTSSAAKAAAEAVMQVADDDAAAPRLDAGTSFREAGAQTMAQLGGAESEADTSSSESSSSSGTSTRCTRTPLFEADARLTCQCGHYEIASISFEWADNGEMIIDWDWEEDCGMLYCERCEGSTMSVSWVEYWMDVDAPSDDDLSD